MAFAAAVAVLVFLVLALGSGAWLLWPRTAAPQVHASWVLTREGPVRFEGAWVLHVPWEQLLRVEIQVHHADLRLQPGASVRARAMALAEGTRVRHPLRVHAHEVEGTLADFVQRATLALHDASNRADMPTFTQPEGPPAAILADLARAEGTTGYAPPEEASMFSRDLKTLCAGLDPDEHAEELKLLSSCRRVDDLAWLADNDGGWLTKNRRNPKIKLVKHGTGTFLVVKYDDGWSTTLAQAPFRGR